MSKGRQTPFRAGRVKGRSSGYADVGSSPQVMCADISEYQPDVADAAYLRWSPAIIIRAMYGDAHDDGAWYGGQRRADLHAGGVQWLGIYQFLVADQDAATQAHALVSLLGKLEPGELPICDLETGSGNQAARWQAWASVIEDAYGISPWLYSGSYFAQTEGLHPQWVAAYQSSPPSMAHLMWQFSESYPVPGVGTCDCSVFGGTIGQLAAYAYGGQKPAPSVREWTTAGMESLADLCKALGTEPSTTLRLTCENSPNRVFPANAAAYVNQVFAADTEKVPAGIELMLGGGWFTTTGDQTLLGISEGRGLGCAGILQSTAEASPSGEFEGNLAGYVNAVFGRSALKVPAGVHLYYEG